MSIDEREFAPPTPYWQPWWTRKTTWGVAVLLLFFAAAAMILTVPGRPAATAGQTTAPTAGSAPAAGQEFPRLDEPSPTSPPAGFSWAGVDSPAWPDSQFLVPEHPVYGPRSGSTAGVVGGFDRSPTGALTAAVNLVARMYDPAQMAASITDGPLRDMALSAAPTGKPQQPALAGFNVVAFTADQAVVQLVEDPGAGYPLMAANFVLVWDGGDWKLDGRQSITWSAAPADYVPWGQGF